MRRSARSSGQRDFSGKTLVGARSTANAGRWPARTKAPAGHGGRVALKLGGLDPRYGARALQPSRAPGRSAAFDAELIRISSRCSVLPALLIEIQIDTPREPKVNPAL